VNNWLWIVLALLVIAGGASLNAIRLAGRDRSRERRSVRARRAELWRRRRDEREGGDDEHER
jgi:hypothetical protein